MSKVSSPDERLIPSAFLFRFSLPCRYTKQTWKPNGAALDASYALPSFIELDGGQPWADVRMGWNETGLLLNVRVAGKRQPPWCRGTRIEDSDGIGLWVDTRDTHNVHRANRFCHEFRLLPFGMGAKLDQPVNAQMLIDRAKDQADPLPSGALKSRSEKRVDGYVLEAFLSGAALTGWDVNEHRRLGFNYVVFDRERGEQPLTVAGEFPFDSDPSLWSTLELVRD